MMRSRGAPAGRVPAIVVTPVVVATSSVALARSGFRQAYELPTG
ncbi:hypothetical protein SAMN05660324_4391 [Klenkia brasiliensis]|uniref:Uncharacterized protein n=1 Tax=Klenkia brasiliensis TaxID=333142 RepID=A0A1G7ZW37_9ACTN|nr:hypothetical protein SAMN05660324_4391 [Klenkia brasiliensis]